MSVDFNIAVFSIQLIMQTISYHRMYIVGFNPQILNASAYMRQIVTDTLITVELAFVRYWEWQIIVKPEQPE